MQNNCVLLFISILISMRLLILALCLSLVGISCKKDEKEQTLVAESYTDLSYGTDVKQKMDLYLPEGRASSKTKLVIIIHGGGWTSGDKSDYTPYIDEFKKRLPGYAFANFNYRLASVAGNYFPTQEADIKAAVQFLLDNSANYAISKDYIIIGISAGAQLGLLQGYKHSDMVQPKGLISYFGPTDLERLYQNSDESIPVILQVITNSTLETDPDLFFQSSPINFVKAGSAPTLLLHGDKDQLVPLEQAELLRDKLQANGVRNELVVYPGQGHDLWSTEALFDSFARIEAFIKGL